MTAPGEHPKNALNIGVGSARRSRSSWPSCKEISGEAPERSIAVPATAKCQIWTAFRLECNTAWLSLRNVVYSSKSAVNVEGDKLATMMVGASVVPEGGSSNDPNDPSVILSMITGGKLKDIDDDGQIVEEDEDEVLLEPGLRRTSTTGGLDTGDRAVLKEIRALREEVANLAKKVGKK